MEIDEQRIADFCRRHHIRGPALFGSVLRDDFTADSDADVLVRFDPEHVPRFALVRMQEELDQSSVHFVCLLPTYGDDSGHWPTTVCHDHLFSCLDSGQILTQPRLEFRYADLHEALQSAL